MSLKSWSRSHRVATVWVAALLAANGAILLTGLGQSAVPAAQQPERAPGRTITLITTKDGRQIAVDPSTPAGWQAIADAQKRGDAVTTVTVPPQAVAASEGDDTGDPTATIPGVDAADLQQLLAGTVDHISTTVRTIIDSTGQTVVSIVDDAGATVSSIVGDAGSTVSSVVDDGTSTVSSVLGSTQSTINSTVSTIQSTVSTLPDTVTSVVQSPPTTLPSVPTTIPNVVTTIQNTVTTIQNTVTTVLPTVPPPTIPPPTVPQVPGVPGL